MLSFWAAGIQGHFFRDIGDDAILLYRCMYSLIVALAASGILCWVWKPLFIPSLAQALHVIMDVLTHGTGKFQTTVFYLLSTWSFDGIRLWQHPEIVPACWLFLPIIWLGLWAYRRGKCIVGF